MLIKPIGLYEAKDNTDLLTRALRHSISNPNVAEMLSVLNNTRSRRLTQAYNFAALLEEAQKEGIGGSLLPVGSYTLLAKVVKVSNSQGGKDQIGIMWQVLDGPAAGQTSWENQTISPENPKAMAAFFGWCGVRHGQGVLPAPAAAVAPGDRSRTSRTS
jgi:hypothetical protein